MEARAGMAETTGDVHEPAWRRRAVSRSLHAARSRAEQRVQRFLDAAFELIDEKGTTDFTIQEVIDRSKQSLRGFYQYFDGKDELILALFEDSVLESAADLRDVVATESDPLERLHAFTIRLHEWCEPADAPRKRGSHNRRPISEFSVQLALSHPARVKAAMEPISRMLLELVEDADAAKAIHVADPRRAAALVQQTVMYSWFGNRLIEDPRMWLTAEQAWEFCLHGLAG
ncbi:MAG TPA: TetR/AcrR family transcriptional regulator [Acidimicrobiia bacterium]|jgi:AcrR family transcriptional regulator|nr:TetR/AcrR family transcriptional regulator [Acidimicrobiia bacterium]